MKKRLVMGFAVFILAVSAFFSPAVPVRAEEPEQTKLYVYNWGEYISNGDDGSLDIIGEFERLNPDIDVVYTTFDTNEAMYAKIASGSANYDVIIPSDYMIGRMIQEDMLAKLDFGNIPNYQYIDEQFKNREYDPGNEYSVPYTWGTVGIIYNTALVDKPVESWDILWDPDYTGQILMFDNPRDAFGIALKKLGYSQNTTDPSQLDEATQLLKDQKPVVQAYVMDQIFAKMSSGEAAIAPYYAGDFFTMQADNPDLDFCVPKEGTNLFFDAMVVPKTSQNKALAERFINFMLEPEIALENIEFIGYSTPMTVVREMLDEEVRESPISYPSEEILSKCDTFVNLDAATNESLQERWTDILSSSGEGSMLSVAVLCAAAVLAAAAFVFLMIRKKKNR
ncbi:MAG: ABC transporter substrate-binding protein [Oscillospiraceae bacterium]|jgi:spermidine/putrescine transport system substrate-binding protein|nr:ABC transporter substrate-binding protein [Oscillospiraceae bacterium]